MRVTAPNNKERDSTSVVTGKPVGSRKLPELVAFDRAASIEAETLSTDGSAAHNGIRRAKGRPKWKWIAAAFVVVSVFAIAAWRAALPGTVGLVRPEPTTITETITATGLVGGYHEAAVGAQAQGIVERLFVKEGALVQKGQLLARTRSDVADAQTRQAEAAREAAVAQFAQASLHPRPSEINSAASRVSQTQATLKDRTSQIARAIAGVAQADAAVEEALAGALKAQTLLLQTQAGVKESVAQVSRAQAAIRMSQARRDLASKTAGRNRELLREQAISQHAADQAEADLRTAEAELDTFNQDLEATVAHREAAQAAANSAQDDIHIAESRIKTAEAARTAVIQDVQSARAQHSVARAAVDAAISDLHTLKAGPRPEAVEVARRQVKQAETAVTVAKEQTRYAEVRAPFAGTVTEIIAEEGAASGQMGIMKIVQTVRPEIRVNVDESNLPDLRVGQRAVITSTAFRKSRAEGRLAEIGSKVDSARGTIELKVVPSDIADWMRPGQTVDVNLIISERVNRLLVPSTALRLDAGRRVALAIKDGRAVARPVVTGQTEGPMVAILEGLEPNEPVIRNAAKVEPGARVSGRVK